MAKSKLVEINEVIAVKCKNGYKVIRDTTVLGYKTVEKTFIDGYKKIEDVFVCRYLIHDGETVEEAKNRIKSQKR